MNKYKDYFYYKGEHLNPYKEGSKESYFWNAECRHSDISQNNPQFIKTICDIFKRDYSEVYQSCKDTLKRVIGTGPSTLKSEPMYLSL